MLIEELFLSLKLLESVAGLITDVVLVVLWLVVGFILIKISKAVTFRIPKKDTLKEMGLPGGAGIGLSLPGGYINGAPDSKDVKKNSKKLNNKGMSGYEEIDEASGNGAFYNDGNTTTGYIWNSDWDDYDKQKYYLDNLEGWDFFDEMPSEREKKKAVDQKLPIDNHKDTTDKYNRILKHDLKSPINGVNFLLDVIKEDHIHLFKNTEAEKQLNLISNRMVYMDNLINEIFFNLSNSCSLFSP